MDEVSNKLLMALKDCLSYIEHSESNRGKITNEAEWEANVAKFRMEGPNVITIGRSYVPKAKVNLTQTRDLIAAVESGQIIPKEDTYYWIRIGDSHEADTAHFLHDKFWLTGQMEGYDPKTTPIRVVAEIPKP